MRKLKVGIRTQLIVLVTFACLFSLLILAVVCGVYFSNNLSDLRAERLEVISQLKTSQVTQALDYLLYQIYWLTTRDAITTPLSSYKAGNNSNTVFDQAQDTLDQFVTSSESFAAARLYNLDLTVVAESTNNASSVSQPSMDYLYPLQANLSVPSQINSLSNQVQSFFMTGPVSNNSDADSTYFVGLTYAVYANTSIILSTPAIAGYLSVIANANNIQQAVNDSESSNDYTVLALAPVFDSDSSTNNTVDDIIGFQAVFPVAGSSLNSDTVYNINSSSAAKAALLHDSGASTKQKNIDGKSVAIGYSTLDLDSPKYWSIIVEQRISTFDAPVRKFTKIIIGVSIGIGGFVCLITFPMTVFFIRPITNLKYATEAITRSKRERERGVEKPESSGSTGNTNSPPPPYYSTLIRRFNNKDKEEEREHLIKEKEKEKSGPNGSAKGSSNGSNNKRNSVLSAGTGGSNSVYSTGIRLPSRIPDSKKIFKDELSELTQAFNIMREELEKQYTHLEDRVKSRTKELEASKIEAEAANEAKTVFIANISHELRTPLNGILGMTSIAMDEEDTSKIKDSLKLINRSGELLLHILTELLTYSKNTLNRSKLEKSSFQILEIAYQVQSIFSKLASDQRVFFKILMKPSLMRKLILYGDSNRIIQVVMNLVSNSLKFTPVDGKVNVTFRLLGEYDQERSNQSDYNQVYVVGHETAANTLSKSNPYDGRPPKMPPTTNEAAFEQSSASSVDADGDDNDTTSIVTLSTTQYQDAVFKSQFKRDMKPLPTVPADSSDTESNFDTDRKLSSSESDDTAPTLPSKDNVLVTSNGHATVSPKLLPPPNMRDKFISTASTSGTGTTTKRPSISSINSSLNSNELVKNDKVYRIKNFYKPKTWVLQIEVTDTGPGIEPALQEKVFEPFIQGDQTLSRSYGGTGLGLSICRQLAKMMNGTMTLKSTLGVGSTFIFTVPLPQVGEVLVPEEDMAEFCEDEFNPKSKMNRKVAFTFNHEDIINEVSEAEDTGYSNEANASSRSELHSTGTPLSTSSPKDSVGPLDLSKINPPNITIELPSPGRKSSEESASKKHYFEKPHLIARSSTGTANSSNGSDKMDLHNNYLLHDLLHLKILVAEDNLVNQEVIRRMLSLEGFTNITMASNGAEAVDNVKESIEKNDVYDLIFMDVQMPKIDGLLATKMIRSNLHYDKPIIALTAFADESNAKECLNSGMSGFLAKPIRRTNLRKIITEFSPILLSETVTTPQTHQSDERRLGYDS
ncbi:Histidine kinase osmosensor [Yamadazyma tenuis]|uniref:histidine kinase n=1 Tax=Candida tenuis (strain ATCC 10573 / BCRC 21748 / CBS 615 / JCM 9827 / NBRC 10315 / NRRL Y-1498 / VKM Y-70) TaxID=590646 RepID=G3BCU0_CANTC|nr:uncharacterized protein CANTEDRAFT_136699 [Yamadazyma tenuis ATCC 10573]EGV60209.1 hypothetical protein CANTEDRAFT_136699 [Yamadazyma tenuis ATCC 10573]WEJ94552.1 Histidine kinase osmosensor [Yamadazyma tenuis]